MSKGRQGGASAGRSVGDEQETRRRTYIDSLTMLKFGFFDHVDYNGKPLGEQLEDRLKLIGLLETERYDVYHVAEHHSTPLGTIPSPSVFLAAVAERTK